MLLVCLVIRVKHSPVFLKNVPMGLNLYMLGWLRMLQRHLGAVFPTTPPSLLSWSQLTAVIAVGGWVEINRKHFWNTAFDLVHVVMIEIMLKKITAFKKLSFH